MYVNKGNVYVNKGKELLVGFGVGDNNNCIQVEDSSAHHCGCVAYAVLLYGSVFNISHTAN